MARSTKTILVKPPPPADVPDQLLFDFCEKTAPHGPSSSRTLVPLDETRLHAAQPVPPVPCVQAPKARSQCHPAYITEARAAELFLQAAREQPRNRIARARVVFKPFRATLYSFKIVRDVLAHVKFHIVFRRAPELVLLQAARIILSRRRGRRALERKAYDAFVRAIPAADFELPGARRGRRQALSTPGRYRSLADSFQRVNRDYFRSQLTQPELCWSPARARRLLGSYQERHDRVIISRLFDSPKVPDYVLDYLVYHELLHKFLGIGRRDDGKRSLHSRDFRHLEKKFRDYRAAMKFLKTM